MFLLLKTTLTDLHPRWRQAVCIFLLLCLVKHPALGQEVELDPVTVTASFVEMRSSGTGRNITVIDGDRFRDLPVHSLDELLRFVPGVEVQSRGPMGSQSDIVLRGATYQQVLVILDGMRLNDPNTGHFSSYIPVAPAEIERIEILKGASSALYGADAVGGVIQVITKTFAKHQGKEQSQLGAAFYAGEFGLINARAGGYYQRRKLQVGGGILTNHSGGVPLRGMDGYFHNTTASVSASYQANNHINVAYRLAADHRDFAAQNFYTTFLSDTASERVATMWHQMRVQWEKGNRQFSLSAALKSVKDRYRFSPHATPNVNHSQLSQLHMQYVRKIASSGSLAAGMNFQQKQIVSNDRGDHRLYLVSPFIVFTQKFAHGIHVRPSIQWVLIQHVHPALVPQLDVSWRHKALQLRAGAGKSIRDADFTERYNNYGKSSVLSGTIGNPYLEPERAFSYEAGGDLFLKNVLKISATWFRRDQKQLIDFSTTPYADMPRRENLVPGGVYALAKNIASVRTTGMETDVQLEKKLTGDHHLIAAAGAVLLATQSSDGVPSFYVSSHARVQLNGFVMYRVKALSVSVTSIHKSRNPQLAAALNAFVSRKYFVMNVQLGYRLGKYITITAECDNLFDKQYSDLLGSKMPGRWFMAGVKFQRP